jgi:hypothetical protein
MRRTLLVALFLVLSGGAAAAETIGDLTAEVPSVPGKTRVDLSNPFFPTSMHQAAPRPPKN